MEFWIRVRDGCIVEASFATDGCLPSIASGSMASELAMGRRLQDVLRIEQKDILASLGGLPRAAEHCALLAANTLKEACREHLRNTVKKNVNERTLMRIAIPTSGGRLAPHFGHCERFVLFDTDPSEKKVLGREEIEAPPHLPGLLPRWLAERGAQVILAGGMGGRARSLFEQEGIEVVVGAFSDAPENLVARYLEGTLQVGDNLCDH